MERLMNSVLEKEFKEIGTKGRKESRACLVACSCCF